MQNHWKWPVIAFIASAGIGFGALAVQEMSDKPQWLVPVLFVAAGILLVVSVVWAVWDTVATLLRVLEWQWPLRRKLPVSARTAPSASDTQETLPMAAARAARELELSNRAVALEEREAKLYERERQHQDPLSAFGGADKLVQERNLLQSLIDFGQSGIDPEPLPEVAQLGMRAQVQELEHVLDPMIEAARSAWDLVGEIIATSNHEPAERAWLYAYVRQHERRHLLNAYTKLHETTKANKDPRNFLALLYPLYREWRTCIVRFALFVECADTKQFRAWLRAEAEFIRVFRAKLKINELDAVAAYVKNYESFNGKFETTAPINMPQSESSSEANPSQEGGS